MSFFRKLNYCSNCGSEKLEDKVPEGDEFSRQVCSSCGVIHYQNPKMITGCLVVKDDKVLLARRNIEPRKGLWNLPCGFLENNETVEQGAIRETWEECHAKVEVERLHCVYDLVGVHQVYLIFFAHMLLDGFGPTTESSEVAFFNIDDIPWDDIAFTSTTFALEKWIESRKSSNNEVYMGSFHKFAASKKWT